MLPAVLVCLAACGWLLADDMDTQPVSGDAVIGKIIIHRKDVFDTSIPGENKPIFRLANRLHIETRESVIRKQLLIKPGDEYSQRLVEESERVLRRNAYLFDASIEPLPQEDGTVDLRVTTRDVWTLTPELSLSRSGGENTIQLGIEELNLAGSGSSLSIVHTDDVDRDSTEFAFANRHLGSRWLSLNLRLADSSDGSTKFINFSRPFFSLDTRRAGGITLLDDDRVESIYDRGQRVAEYRRERQFLSVFGGLSSGLRGGWVRRWTAGITLDESNFGEPRTSSLPSIVPADRKLVYPFIAYELLEDRFSKTRNLDSIEKTEDFYLGTRLTAQLGWANRAMGSDRGALVYGSTLDLGFGSPGDKMLLVSSRLSGRLEDGAAANVLLGVNTRYYKRQSEKRSFFVTVSAATSDNLDLDNPLELGGDNGLRGYPLRYQRGKSRALVTLEQRYYTDWYPLRLLRVGGAIFADLGRTWGANPVGTGSDGWLKDVGFGLRLVPTRGSPDKVYHIDLAFPLDGDASIDNVQLLLEGKRGF